MTRKLFIAIDKNGTKYHIDKLEDPSMELFCPFCKKAVIPKFGNVKVNHFAHKDLSCGLTKQNEGKETSLSSFKTISSKEFFDKKPESEYFACPICKATIKKEYGIKFDETRFVCKNCIPRIKELI
ncbi:hypothetical protein JXM83_00225 [Candidatus Woesearchaeota archaeon]|nr:hypothetical protein [Candidatus Woesearchaeota archaeon]